MSRCRNAFVERGDDQLSQSRGRALHEHRPRSTIEGRPNFRSEVPAAPCLQPREVSDLHAVRRRYSQTSAACTAGEIVRTIIVATIALRVLSRLLQGEAIA